MPEAKFPGATCLGFSPGFVAAPAFVRSEEEEGASNPDIGKATTLSGQQRSTALGRSSPPGAECAWSWYLPDPRLHLQLRDICCSWRWPEERRARGEPEEREQDAPLLPLADQHSSDRPVTRRITKSISAHQTTNHSTRQDRNCDSRRAKQASGQGV